MITLYYADRTLAIDANPLAAIAADGSSMTVDAATPVTSVNGIKSGDLILFTNSRGSVVQMVTATPTSQVVQFAANDALRFNQRTAPQGTILNLQQTPGVYPPTTATRVFLISYFIDSTTVPTLPRLVRQIGNGPRLPIAMGVENLQFTYDLVDGVTNPTNQQTIPVGNSANQLRKVNLFLSARSKTRIRKRSSTSAIPWERRWVSVA